MCKNFSDYEKLISAMVGRPDIKYEAGELVLDYGKPIFAAAIRLYKAGCSKKEKGELIKSKDLEGGNKNIKLTELDLEIGKSYIVELSVSEAQIIYTFKALAQIKDLGLIGSDVKRLSVNSYCQTLIGFLSSSRCKVRTVRLALRGHAQSKPASSTGHLNEGRIIYA